MICKNVYEYSQKSNIDNYVKNSKHHKFNLSENSKGPSPRVLDRLKKITLEDLSCYPNSSFELEKKYAEFVNVDSDNIYVGNGSNEIIENIARIFINPNDFVLIPTPTFHRFEDASSRCGGNTMFHKLNNACFTKQNKNNIVDMILDKQPKITWISNPNSVTGKLVDPTFIQEIVDACNNILVVDEAFIEYTNTKSSISLLSEYPNIIVLRTMSKIFGLAGLRIGFAVSSKEIIKILRKLSLDFSINSISRTLATESLSDLEHLQSIKKSTSEQRSYLFKNLNNLGFEFIKSSTNTVLIRLPNRDIFNELTRQNILTGDFRYSKGIEKEGYVRITIGDKQKNQLLVSKLEKIVND